MQLRIAKQLLQWNPDFANLRGKRILVRKIGGKIAVFSTEEGKLHLVRVIKRFEKLRVREIGIPL